jgi:DNA-binding NtrC family response regulator
MPSKLLVINQEPFDREITRKIFHGKYELAFASNASELEPMLNFFSPEVILYEIMQDSIEQITDVLVKTGLQQYQPPLVLVISENSMELEKAARACGVFYCLIRPFNLKELWDALEAAFAYSVSKNANVFDAAYPISKCN